MDLKYNRILELDIEEQSPFGQYPLAEMMTLERALEAAHTSLQRIKADCQAAQGMPEEARRRSAVMHEVIATCAAVMVAEAQDALRGEA